MILPSLTQSAYEMHFLVGVVITLIARRCWFVPALVLGIGKEVFDFFYHGDPDWIDAAVTIAAAAMTAALRLRLKNSSDTGKSIG